MMEFNKLRRHRAVDEVYDALHNAIVTYVLKPGERLDVEDLSLKLGVSLTPVRGAVQQLATEGLVEIRPRSGTFVANLSSQDVEETFQIRCALECLAAELGVPQMTAENIKRLKDLLRSLKKQVRNAEERKLHEADNFELHQIIILSSGNRRLKETYEALNAHIKIARIHAADANWPARQKLEHAEHEAIVAAIEARDTHAACEALRQHVYRAKDALVGALREREAQSASE